MTENMTDVVERIETFIEKELAFERATQLHDREQNLLAMGLVDSLGVVKLMAFIKDTFGINVTDADVVPEHFQTINSIAEFVQRKQQSYASVPAFRAPQLDTSR